MFKLLSFLYLLHTNIGSRYNTGAACQNTLIPEKRIGRKRKENGDGKYRKRKGRIGKQSRKGKKKGKWKAKRGKKIGQKQEYIRHGTGSLGHRVNGSFESSFTSGSPGHHFYPV